MDDFRRIWIVFAVCIAVILLSVGTDVVLEPLGVFPPQSEPGAYTAGTLMIALIVRSVYTVAGGYITAWLAQNRPMSHAIILGLVGIVAGAAGVVVAWDLSPHWYPIAVIIGTLACAWLGGTLKTQARNLVTN